MLSCGDNYFNKEPDVLCLLWNFKVTCDATVEFRDCNVVMNVCAVYVCMCVCVSEVTSTNAAQTIR